MPRKIPPSIPDDGRKITTYLFYNFNFAVTMREEWSDAMVVMNKSGRSNIYIELPLRVAA